MNRSIFRIAAARVAAAALLLALTGAGYAAADPGNTAVDPKATSSNSDPPAAREGRAAFGHAPTDITLELTPTQIERRGGSDELSVDLSVANSADGDLSAVIAYEIRDDRGNIVLPAKIGAKSALTRGASRSQGRIVVPAALDDGFYFVRAIGAWAGDTTKGTTASYLYFEVESGRITIVNESDWQQRSRVQEGVIQ